MVKIKKHKLESADIPTSSMADIGFLLLLFFLVATTIDVDTGIGLVLPRYVPPSEQQFVKIAKDRMAALLINANGDVLLNGKIIAIPQIENVLVKRIASKINLPAKKKLIVSIKTDRKTVYNLFIQALDQVKSAYFKVRNEYALNHFGKPVKKLNKQEVLEIRKKIPIIISIAEPEKVK